jgi:uncharacterized GH25 family protein
MSSLKKLTFGLALGWAASLIAQTNAPPSFLIKGRTVDGEGHPVPGATVQQYSYHQSAGNRFDLERLEEATSDANGSFELRVSGASAMPQVPVFLIARKPGLAAAWTQVMANLHPEPRLVLTSPSVLAGKVVDEADKPIANAEVTVMMANVEAVKEDGSRSFEYLGDKPARDLFAARTDADGRFRIQGFPNNASANLQAEAPGKALRSTGQQVFRPDSLPYRSGQEDIQLVLENAGSVEGKISMAESGASLPQAQIHVLPTGPGFIAMSSREGTKAEPDGSFKLKDLGAGSYRLQAVFGTNEALDWVAETVPVTVESGQVTRGVQITAIRGGLLEVAVHAPDGRPIPEAGVNVYREGYQSGHAANSNGVARLRLPPGDYQIGAYKQGWQQANSSGSVEDGKTNRVEMELVPPRRLTGLVHLPDGQPGTNLAIQVIGDYSMQQANLRTGADGRFDIEWNSQRFPGNNMTPCLLIRDPARNLAVGQDLDDETAQLDLRLAPAVSFSVRVECDGKPLTNASANLLFRTGNMGMYLNGMTSRGAAPGQIEVLALPPGRNYGLQITAPGYGSKSLELTQNAEEAKRVELDPVELKRADRKLAGKLVDTEDKPVAGAMVQIMGEGQPNANSRTDKEGRFSFDVCEGMVQLFANSQRNFANSRAEAGDTNVVLRLGERMAFGGDGKLEKLKGTVTDGAGKPITGADVRVFPADMPNQARTDTNGAFQVSYIMQPWQRQNGNPLLIVRDHTHNLAAAQEIPKESTNLTVQLEPSLKIRGRVVGPDNKPLSNAQVNLMLQANRMGGQVENQPTMTDAQGDFTFAALPVGQDYSLYATLPGYSQKHQKVEADWDANVVDVPPIMLRIPNQVIAGQVIDAKDKPMAGVHVQVASDDQPQTSSQTDSKGRFKFKVCEGQVHLFANGQMGFAQATAEAGDTNVVILLTDQSARMSRPARVAARGSSNASLLKGKPLPDLNSLGFAADAAPPGKPVLLCLLDVQQRPSRRMARLLGDQLEALRGKGITVLAAQFVPATDENWNDWKDANPVQFPITRLSNKAEKPRWASGLENLPWLILSDKKGVVAAEGFDLDELDSKMAEVNK